MDVDRPVAPQVTQMGEAHGPALVVGGGCGQLEANARGWPVRGEGWRECRGEEKRRPERLPGNCLTRVAKVGEPHMTQSKIPGDEDWYGLVPYSCLKAEANTDG